MALGAIPRSMFPGLIRVVTRFQRDTASLPIALAVAVPALISFVNAALWFQKRWAWKEEAAHAASAYPVHG